jgi:hypothetical protein
VVEPVDPLERRVFDVIEPFHGPRAADQLGPVEPDDKWSTWPKVLDDTPCTGELVAQDQDFGFGIRGDPASRRPWRMIA